MTEYFDDAVVHAAAGAVRVGLDELLSGVDQAHVVDERRLRPGVQHDRVVVDVADRQVRDRDAPHVAADPDAERDAAVVRASSPSRPARRRRGCRWRRGCRRS